MTNHARILLGLALLVLLAACGSKKSGAQGQSHLDRIKARGKLVVGMEPKYQPFEMKTKDGTLIGFDVELARLLGKELGVEIVFKDLDWKGIIPALETGNVDCIISGLSITDERKQRINFSKPYFQIGQVVLINAKDKGRYRSYRDLNQPGLVITTQANTTGQQAAEKFMNKAKVKTFPNAAQAAQEVQEGRAAGMVFDHPFIESFARNNQYVAILSERFTKEDIGIGLRKSSPALLAALDAALAKLEREKALEPLVRKYFVEKSWQK